MPRVLDIRFFPFRQAGWYRRETGGMRLPVRFTVIEESKMGRIIKEPVCRERIRRISGGFGWVDHRLVRDHYIERCSHLALATYLFVVTVADADGVSYWGDRAIAERLHAGIEELRVARAELIAADLIAYDKPVWQVLQLPRCKEISR
jgi:hypothetical protein